MMSLSRTLIIWPLWHSSITASCPTYILNTRSGNNICICNLDKQMYKNNVLCFFEVPSETEIARSAYCYYGHLFRRTQLMLATFVVTKTY